MPNVFLPEQEILEGKLSRKGQRNALEGSLRRLQTDYTDFYYEHSIVKSSNALDNF